VLVTDEIRGWSRYAINIIAGAARAGHNIFLFSDRPINEALLPKDISVNKVIREGLNYIDWEQRVLPDLCRENQIELLHCPTNYGLPLAGDFKKILTLHDAIEKSFYDELKGIKRFLSFNHWKIRGLHYVSQRAADKIITVSHHACRDIVQSYRVPREKMEVIYEGADPEFSENHVKDFGILAAQYPSIKPPYFFYVGGLEDRKNIDFLLKSWKKAELAGYQLVIGGGGPVENYRRKVAANQVPNVEFTGYIPQNLLPSFYHYSHCFVYPSLYEGFGLQVVEALQMGRPVICSNVSSLPELLSDADCTFDPRNEHDLARLLRQMTNERFAADKASRQSQRRVLFSWRECTEKTLGLYDHILS